MFDARNPKDREYVKLGVGKIFPVGTYTGAFGMAVCKGIHQFLNEEKTPVRGENIEENVVKEEEKKLPKFYKNIKAHELRFEGKLEEIGLKIKIVAGDGNCLFRSVSDQVYGNEELHGLVREYCMNYINVEREFFSQYIVGGIDAFDEYITNKRQNGIWGDDLEIEALSEIYELPIEIYAYDNKPMRTFHETSNNNTTTIPLRISYHGRSHFNSVRQVLNIDCIIKTTTSTYL